MRRKPSQSHKRLALRRCADFRKDKAVSQFMDVDAIREQVDLIRVDIAELIALHMPDECAAPILHQYGPAQ